MSDVEYSSSENEMCDGADDVSCSDLEIEYEEDSEYDIIGDLEESYGGILPYQYEPQAHSTSAVITSPPGD